MVELYSDAPAGMLASVAMLRSELKYGFAQIDWDSAKKEARAVMIERAKMHGMISYSDLVKCIRTVKCP
jgi:hypothetical protein